MDISLFNEEADRRLSEIIESLGSENNPDRDELERINRELWDFLESYDEDKVTQSYEGFQYRNFKKLSVAIKRYYRRSIGDDPDFFHEGEASVVLNAERLRTKRLEGVRILRAYLLEATDKFKD